MCYVDLHCFSNFSFQRGASSASELFDRAKVCGCTALAVADERSLAGIVCVHEAALDTGMKLIVGSEFNLRWTEAGAVMRDAGGLQRYVH